MTQTPKLVFGCIATGCAIVATTLVVATGVPQDAQAQSRGGASATIGGAGSLIRPGGAGVSFNRITNLATEQIVFLVQSIGAFCSKLPDRRYEVDCLADQYEQVASTMARNGEYAGARQAIEQTSKRLRGLAAANRAADAQPAQLAGTKTAHASSRPIVPIDRARTKAARVRAAQIVEEGQTLLLRSAERSERRKVAYTQIAEALESNKVLLRSA
ncbi:hypothetical protein [Oceaniglobus roseus]|uniref:hypothetical protein n=1 Tax=Oceaniglobus roseus TaxID=1737570 RepID=UPI000C7EA83C|nr:hypothetical protein [Kandeliimicrobium roseum]